MVSRSKSERREGALQGGVTALCALLFAMTACTPILPDDPDSGPTEQDAGAMDAGPTDAGHDSGPMDGGSEPDGGPNDGGLDGGPCTEACTGTTPFCDAALGRCVECVAATDCAPAPAATCADTRHISTSEAFCDAGACTYPLAETRCPGGCEAGACNVDVWVPLPPSGHVYGEEHRLGFSVVWTGTEMILWGGGYAVTSGGLRYNVETDGWSPTSFSGAPTARREHTAVWTGTEMIVWGGAVAEYYFASGGGRYNPTTDTWTPMSATSAPGPRRRHSAVWTGTEMIVWGGLAHLDGQMFQTAEGGGRYNPSTDSWSPLSTSGAPSGYLRAVWADSEMLVWTRAGGAAYDPVADAWRALLGGGGSIDGASVVGVWTGVELLQWGGYDGVGEALNSGVRFLPSVEASTPISMSGAPSARGSHTAVWTGTEMIVFGGYGETVALGDGGRYNPVTNAWRALPSEWAPSARFQHEAIWTGEEMIVWGPHGTIGGARYVPGP